MNFDNAKRAADRNGIRGQLCPLILAVRPYRNLPESGRFQMALKRRVLLVRPVKDIPDTVASDLQDPVRI